MDPQILNAIQALDIAGRKSPGIAKFLTTGEYSALNPNEKQYVDRIIGRTQYAGRPGEFYLAWRQQNQAQAGQQDPNAPDRRTGAPAQGGVPSAPMPGENLKLPTASGPGGQVAPNGVGDMPTPSPAPSTTYAGGDNPFAGTAGMPGQTATPQAVAQATQVARPTTPTLRDVPPSSQFSQNNNGSPFSASQADWLANADNDMLLRFALQNAGFNPDIVTGGSRVAAQKLLPMLAAARSAFGAGEGANGNVGGLPAFLQQFAQGYTQKGNDFYGNARNFAQGVLGSPDFGGFLSGVKDQNEQFQLLQSLTPLLFGGANPMVQQSVGDQIGNLFDKFRYDEFQNGKQSSLVDYLNTRGPQLNPAIQALFGPLMKR